MLRDGASVLNEAAPDIMATILGYARNPKHPHHEWALKLIAERVIPRKMYADLGARMTGSKSGAGRPAVTIIVQQAAPVPPDSPPLDVEVVEVPDKESE